MARLPQPGGDQDTWGNVLNDFLGQAHNTDGTLKTDSVGAAQLKPSAVASANLADGAVTNQKLDTSTQTSLTKADSSVQSVNGKTPTAGAVALSTTDLSDVNATALATGDVLTYDATSSKWSSQPAPVTSVAGQTGAVTGAMIAADAALRGTYVTSASYAPQADDIYETLLNSDPRQSIQNTPVVTWATSAQIATPVITYPAIVNTGSSKSGWDGRSNPTESHFWFDGGSFSTGNGGSGDLEMHGDLMPGGSSQAAYWPLSFEFVTSSVAQFEMEIYAPGSYGFTIEIEGIPMGSYDYVLGGSLEYILFTFPTAAVRYVRVMCGFLRLRSIRVPAGGSLSAPSITRRTGVIIGDSWVGGGGGIGVLASSANREATYASRLLRLMGATERINMGIGGTGFVTGGSTNAYYTRIAAALTKSPSFMVFQGSGNDAGNSVATIQAAIENVLALTDTVSERYVLTSFWSDTNQLNVNAAVRAAVAAHGNNVKLVDVAGSIAGSGNLGSSPVGTRGLFIGADNAHPSAQGHSYLARRAFRLISPYLGY